MLNRVPNFSRYRIKIRSPVFYADCTSNVYSLALLINLLQIFHKPYQLHIITVRRYFSDQDYATAIDLYGKAIELNPSVAVYYGNRSFAYLKTECFGYALTDASKAIELDKNYVKGYYRRAAAHMSLGKFKLALKDYKTVTTARPNDKDAMVKYSECSKILKKLAFEKAISVDENKKNIADMINLEAMGELPYPTL